MKRRFYTGLAARPIASPKEDPTPKAPREVLSKYPRLENGFPVGSLDPVPIKKRDADIDAIWKSSVQHFKAYLDDIVVSFDVADIRFNRQTSSQAINAVRDAIYKRLTYDGIKSGRISMPSTQQHISLELLTPGYQVTASALQKEIFSLITIDRPVDPLATVKKPR